LAFIFLTFVRSTFPHDNRNEWLFNILHVTVYNYAS
jgi:hypothetical protein